MELYDHQKKIVADDPEKTGLFLGTGSGKTLIALLLARGKTLVICPKTQKEDRNWERENEKNNLNIDLTTISKETFRRDADTLPAYDTIIIDEAHKMLGITPNTRWRNKQEIPKTSQLFEALERYIQKTKPKRMYLCTATIMKSPFTVWGAMKILGKTSGTMQGFYSFRNRFYVKLPMPGREVWVPKQDKGTKEFLVSLVKEMGYVGRLEDFFDVPEQTFKDVYIELTPKQKQRIKDLTFEYPDPIVRTGKRHQIENGNLLGDEFSQSEIFDNGKIEKLLDYASEFPRIIVFAKYTLQIEQIEKAMRKAGYKIFTLTGKTKERGQIFSEAKNSEAYVFIVQAQISEGWELPDCPVLIFASRTYSFVDYDQALGRIQRSNNIKKNLYINLIVKGGTDEAVHKALLNKQDFNEHLYAKGS